MEESPKQESEDSADIEKMLAGMRPIAPSEHFFNAVSAELNGNGAPDNTLRIPRGGRWSLRFPMRRAAASAAIVLSAVGAGVWGISSSGGRSASGGIAGSVPAAANSFAAAVPAAGVQSSRSRGNYRLVNVERTIDSVMPAAVEMLDSGNLSQEVHYSYVDEYSWENQETGAAYLELRPNKAVVSMELPVY